MAVVPFACRFGFWNPAVLPEPPEAVFRIVHVLFGIRTVVDALPGRYHYISMVCHTFISLFKLERGQFHRGYWQGCVVTSA